MAMTLSARRCRRGPVAAVALALALAGCSGNMEGESSVETVDRIAEALRALGTDTPEAAAPLQMAATGPSLYVEIPAREARALLSVSGVNGPVTTWRSADAVSLSLSGPGVVVATRGLSHDLHIAEAAASTAALAAGRPARELPRTHRRLGGDGRLHDSHFRCAILAAGRETLQIAQRSQPALRFEEHCAPADGTTAEGSAAFTNIYWRDPTRPLIWQSQQLVTPEIGPMLMQRVVD